MQIIKTEVKITKKYLALLIKSKILAYLITLFFL